MEYIGKEIKKNSIQQNLYAMPFGTLRIAGPLYLIKRIVQMNLLSLSE